MSENANPYQSPLTRGAKRQPNYIAADTRLFCWAFVGMALSVVSALNIKLGIGSELSHYLISGLGIAICVLGLFNNHLAWKQSRKEQPQ